jgi:hypothetical protein
MNAVAGSDVKEGMYLVKNTIVVEGEALWLHQ